MERSILGTFHNQELILIGSCSYALKGYDLSGGKCILDLKEFGPLLHLTGPKSKMLFKNFLVVNGKSLNWGGALVVSGGAQVQFEDVVFENNMGGNGGAVAILTFATVR